MRRSSWRRRCRGIVVGDDDLVGVIRVGRSVCLRLGDVWNLGAGDQIDVRASKRQGLSACLEKLTESIEGRKLNLPVPRRRKS